MDPDTPTYLLISPLEHTVLLIKLQHQQKLQRHIWVQNLRRGLHCALDCMIPPLCLSCQRKLIRYKKLNLPPSHFSKAPDCLLPKFLIVLKAISLLRIDRQSTKCHRLLILRVLLHQRIHLVPYLHLIGHQVVFILLAGRS
uniref:Uncharacterized protein n=1 Tax=Arundo donax TaxID=35708 RepID=A0A0A8YUQ6_ARUDO